ncbi:MAG: HAD family hydrolase [Thermoanaerobaculia bacterium]
MTKPLLVFDLDGTLIDGYTAIGQALAYAMERLNLSPPPDARVRAMVGHGLERLLEQAVGRQLAPEGVRLFRERYPEIAVEGSHLLPGVAETLDQLSAGGYPMALASNKPARFSRLILEAKGVARHFRAIEGPDESTPAKPDPAMLRRILLDAGVPASGSVVIGDMDVDAEFARAGGALVVLIPNGSRSREELESAGADGLIESIRELPAWLERHTTIGAP